MPPFNTAPSQVSDKENPRKLWESLEGDFYRTPLGDQIKQSLALEGDMMETLDVIPENFRELFFIDGDGKIQAKSMAIKSEPVASEFACESAWTQKHLEELLSDKENLANLGLSESELIKLNEVLARSSFLGKFADVNLSMNDIIAGFSSKSLDSQQTPNPNNDQSLRYPVKYKMMPPTEIKDIIFYGDTGYQGAGITSYVECFSEKNLNEFCLPEEDKVLFSDKDGRQWQISKMVGDTKDNQLGSRDRAPVTIVVYCADEATYIGFKSAYGYTNQFPGDSFVRNPTKELLLETRYKKFREENEKELDKVTVDKLERSGIYIA